MTLSDDIDALWDALSEVIQTMWAACEPFVLRLMDALIWVTDKTWRLLDR